MTDRLIGVHGEEICLDDTDIPGVEEGPFVSGDSLVVVQRDVGVFISARAVDELPGSTVGAITEGLIVSVDDFGNRMGEPLDSFVTKLNRARRK